MVVKKNRKSGRSCSGTSDYITGRDGEHADGAVEATGFSCPGRPDVLDVDDAAAWLDREAEAYRLQGGPGKSYAHWVISFEKNEHPTPEQVAEMIPIWREKMGMPPEAPLLWGIHVDTQHVHVHIQASTVIESRAQNGKSIYKVESLNHEDVTRDAKRGGRMRLHEYKAAHRAGAEICERQGWNPENLAWDTSGNRVRVARNPNALNLSSKIKDSEAITGKEHPSHTLALTAVPILRSAKSASEAREMLAAAGISIEIKTLKNGGQGAVLSTPLGARTKLSSLPSDCSLKNLNLRFQTLGPSLSDSKPGPKPNTNAAIKLAVATATRKAQPQRAWTPSQAKNQFKRIVSDSVDWTDVLRGMQREGWHLARSGKSGALLVFGEDEKQRLKLSDIGRGFSYGKLSEKFENSLENQVTDDDLISAVVTYPAQSPKIEAQNVTTTDDPNAIRLPSSITDDEALTGQPSALRRMAETAVETIRQSKATGINGLASDLAAKGIEMRPAIQGGQMYGIRLTSPGVQGSVSLAALPRDCRLSALAQRYGETYRHRPDRFRPNSRPDGKPIGTLVQISPDDDALEIIRKTLEAIAQDLAAGGMPASWDRDTRPITLVRPRPANQDAALDHRVPVDLPSEQASTWRKQEIIKGIFRGALEKINAQRAENPDAARLGWRMVGEELDRRGWRLEMIERDLQVVTPEGEAHRLAELEINTLALVRAWGEPDAPLVPLEGETPEQTAERREGIVYERHIRIEAGDAARLLREPLDVETLLAKVEARGWQLEDTINSVRVVLDGRTAVDVSRLKIDSLDLFDRLDGRRLPVANWKDMDDAQRRSAIERIELRETLRAKSWEVVLDRLERRGARIELTGGGQGKEATGGRVALADGRKIPLSAMGAGLAQLRAKKTGNLGELVRTREQARKAKTAPAPAPAPAPKPSKSAQDDIKKATEAEKRAEAAKILKELQAREKQETQLKRQDADARTAKTKAIKQAPTPQAAQAAQATKLKTDQNQQLKAQEQAKAKARTQDQQAQARTQQDQRERERLEKERKEREREKEKAALQIMENIRQRDVFKPSPSNASKEIDNISKLMHENRMQEQRDLAERVHQQTIKQQPQESPRHGY